MASVCGDSPGRIESLEDKRHSRRGQGMHHCAKRSIAHFDNKQFTSAGWASSHAKIENFFILTKDETAELTLDLTAPCQVASATAHAKPGVSPSLAVFQHFWR